jgi:hypothetical protein
VAGADYVYEKGCAFARCRFSIVRQNGENAAGALKYS